MICSPCAAIGAWAGAAAHYGQAAFFLTLPQKAWVQAIPHAMEKFRVPPFLEMGYPKLLFFIRWLIWNIP